MIGEIFIPPSANWFLRNAIDSRTKDGLLVAASFKSIVVYQVSQESGLPKIAKIFPFNNEKVILVRLHPDCNHTEYGNAVAYSGDGHSVKVISLESGAVLWYQNEHKDATINGLSWGMFGEESALVSVDSKGRLVVWQPSSGVTRVHKLPHMNNLTCVEVNPNDMSQAVVGGGDSLVLVELKDGKVLTQFQGHNQDIYCVKWFPIKEDSPLSLENGPVETRVADSETGDEKKLKGSDSDNWRSKSAMPSSSGPFIVSSDYGRQILLWDVSAKRYITKVSVPIGATSFQKKYQGKEKPVGKQHISLSWHDGTLISSAPKGEVLSWNLWAGGGKYTVLNHLHTRAIYNLEVVGDVIVTCGQDRVLHGYHLPNSSHLFQYPLLGASASALAFCPHDVNRLAIGSQENAIRFVNFESEVPMHTQVVWQNIKGKMLTMAWHPEHEGRLLFGTAAGQVAWVDMSSCRVTSYAYYHQKATYKVEWAPAMCPDKTGFSDKWCAYSFGDKEIVLRSASDQMADPVKLLPLLTEKNAVKPLKDVTEFSFSCDYKFLAIGTNDGQIHVFRTSDMELAVSMFVLRKAIQHILWQPPSSSAHSYVFAVGSSEHRICIFDVTSQLLDETDKVEVLTQATRELCGHESRVVWLSWSPHQVGVLASASYDHTIQLWNADTGEPLINYGGHSNRTFRAEFSPSDPDLMYSFAEENSIHVWKPSQLSSRTPAESFSAAKEVRSKKAKELLSKEEDINEGSAVEVEKKTLSASSTSEKSTASSTFVTSNKKAAYKSFFPKLHAVCSKKKSFFHMAVMSLMSLMKDGRYEQSKDKEVDLEEDLCDELEESTNSEPKEEDTQVIEGVLKEFSFLLDKDSEIPKAEEMAYALNMYGKPQHMDTLLTSEIGEHVNRGNIIQADLMHCWQGSLDENIRNAARNKTLTPFLVSSAPQVSFKLWEFACQAYSDQLVEEGDVISAATYLVNINKVEEAVELLVKHKYFREAMAITKCRLGYNEELINSITKSWASHAVFEGAFDYGAILQISLGQVEEAARTMGRRNDHGSLFISSQLYKCAGKKDLMKSIGILALKEACVRQDYDKIEAYLSYIPELAWFNLIACCHRNMYRLIQHVTTGKSTSYLIPKTWSSDAKETPSTENVDTETKETPSTENVDTETKEVIPTSTENVDDTETTTISIPFLQFIKEEWSRLDISCSQYPALYESITSSLSAQQMPTSVKQLWFLVTVELCKFLISSSHEEWESHLNTTLNYALSWGKMDHISHLTHSLLPGGISDLSSIPVKDFVSESATSSAITLLRLVYQLSELSLLHTDLKRDEVWTLLNSPQGGISESNTSTEATFSDVGQRETTESECMESKTELTSQNVNSSDVTSSNPEDGSQELTKDETPTKMTDLESTSKQNLNEFPKSPADLLARLNSLCDFFIQSQEEDTYKKVVDSMCEPKKLLLELCLQLKEKLDLKDESQLLLCKISSMKS